MKKLTREELELLEAKAAEVARDDFWAYRRFMNPTMKIGWWQREVARQLQLFYADFIDGKRPILVLTAPPQHGKSIQIVEFLAWVLGRHASFPERCGVFSHQRGLRQVYGSFSDRLGSRANAQIQRMLLNPRYRLIFPGARLPSTGDRESANRDIIELPGTDEAYFRNTTVGGAITGESLDLGAVDDPLKGRKDASSETVRDTAWNWFTDDLFTRFSEYAALLIILTRWHVDDPVGRLIEMNEEGELDMEMRIVNYKAVATEDEYHPDFGPIPENTPLFVPPGNVRPLRPILFRCKGEALFPEHKSIEFLNVRKSIMAETNWEALYQQSPFIASGGMFPIQKFEIVDYVNRNEVMQSARAWDKAGTKDGDGAETAGVLMHRLVDGTYLIEDCVHGRWSALEREERIKQTAAIDGRNVHIYVEQEPGSGGKESAESTIRNNPGSAIFADRPTGDKVIRAEPYAAQVQGGNMKLLRADWNRAFLSQHEQFPNGKLKDMVDAAGMAFAKVCDGIYDIRILAS